MWVSFAGRFAFELSVLSEIGALCVKGWSAGLGGVQLGG